MVVVLGWISEELFISFAENLFNSLVRLLPGVRQVFLLTGIFAASCGVWLEFHEAFRRKSASCAYVLKLHEAHQSFAIELI